MTKKNRDKNGRWRHRNVSFHATDEEVKAIDEAVALSGLTKQEYIINKLTSRDIIIVGNPRVFIRLKKKMEEIYLELLRLNSSSELSNELLETIKFVAEIFAGMIERKGDD